VIILAAQVRVYNHERCVKMFWAMLGDIPRDVNHFLSFCLCRIGAKILNT
jgi:hypothetical protein